MDDSINSLFTQLVVEFPSNDLKNKIETHKHYKEYSQQLKKYIIDNMSDEVVKVCRSTIAMCGNIRNIDNNVIKQAIIDYINDLNITNSIILHIIDNISKNSNKLHICGLYDHNISCKIYSYIKYSN